MDADQIENTYKQEAEKAEKEFLDGLKNNADRKKLEQSYNESLKKARAKYYKHIAGHLLEEKPKEKKKKKKEKDKVLDTSHQSLKHNIFERAKYKLHIWFFKIHFKTRNFRRAHTPDWISFLYIRAKIRTKKIKEKIKDNFAKMIEGIKKSFEAFRDWMKKKSKKMYEFLVKLPEKIMDKLSKKKKKEDDKDSKEEDSKEEEKEEVKEE